MQHPVRVVQRPDRVLVLALENQVGVALVLEDGHAVFLAQLQHSVTAFHGQHGAGGVLQGRDRVDVLRTHAPVPQVFQRLLQVVHAHAVIVHIDANDVDLAPPQVAQGARETERLDDCGVALFQQDLVDQLYPLAGPRRDQNVVNGGVDAAMLTQLSHQELPQRKDALRPAGEVIHGDVAGVAAEHSLRRLDEPFRGNHLGVAVPADEVVLGVTSPRSCGRRQVSVE